MDFGFAGGGERRMLIEVGMAEEEEDMIAALRVLPVD
jgi:hypothetical protein